MPRSLIVQRINPEVVEGVLGILRSSGQEFVYETKPQNLAVYVKEHHWKDHVFEGVILVDCQRTIVENNRKGGEILTTRRDVISVTKISYEVISEIKGSGSVSHAFLALGSLTDANIASHALESLLGVPPFLRVKFLFTATNQSKIRNVFTDVVRIRGDDVSDPDITAMSLSGSRLYDADQYQKAFTGDVQYLGLQLNNDWFIVKANGIITTYRRQTDTEFVAHAIEIIEALLSVDAVVS